MANDKEITRISVHPNEKSASENKDPVYHIYYKDGTDERIHTNKTSLPGSTFKMKQKD